MLWMLRPPRVQRSGNAAGAQDGRPADAEAWGGVHGGVQKGALADSTYGPPPPPQASRLPACPSSSERWAGPGGRLGRYPSSQLALVPACCRLTNLTCFEI